MNAKQLMFLILILSITATKAQDYSELKNIYTDFVKVLKSKNDNALKDFCYKLAADETTISYMSENYLCYRGIPCEIEEKGIDIKAIGDNLYPNLLRVRNSLISSGLMDQLVHIDSTEYMWEIVIIVNEKKKGIDKPISQEDYSLSQQEFKKITDMIDSTGQSFNELILNGREGEVYLIKGTEMPMYLESGDKVIEYPIGEMVFINKKWSLFTEPNVDYYVRKK